MKIRDIWTLVADIYLLLINIYHIYTHRWMIENIRAKSEHSSKIHAHSKQSKASKTFDVPWATLKSFVDNLLSSLFKINVSSYLYVPFISSTELPQLLISLILVLVLFFILPIFSSSAPHSGYLALLFFTLYYLFIHKHILWPDKTINRKLNWLLIFFVYIYNLYYIYWMMMLIFQ